MGIFTRKQVKNEVLGQLETALDVATRTVDGHTKSLKALEAEHARCRAAARAAELAVGNARKQLEAHRENRMQVRLEQVPAWSQERIRLEALLEDLGYFSNHAAQVEHEAATRLASMRRLLEKVQGQKLEKTQALAEEKRRH